jgi:hypothetical protein
MTEPSERQATYRIRNTLIVNPWVTRITLVLPSNPFVFRNARKSVSRNVVTRSMTSAPVTNETGVRQ